MQPAGYRRFYVRVLCLWMVSVSSANDKTYYASSGSKGEDLAASPVWYESCAKGATETVEARLLPSDRRRALVTGAAGFIGSHVAEYCVKVLGMHVVAVDDLSGGFKSNLHWWNGSSSSSSSSSSSTSSSAGAGSIQFVQGDVRDAKFLAGLFTVHRFDYVYHLAAFAAEGLSHFIRSFIYRNNLVGSTELLNAAVKHNVSCFTFTSSIAVYGASQEPPMLEETAPVPEDPYGISKYAFELDLKAAQRMFGMDFVVFRPHNVYGPRQNLFDPYRNVVGIFFNQLLRGEPMTIFGDGEQLRAFSYIDDVAPVIARGPIVQGARNQVFNVGADEPHSLNYLAAAVYDAARSQGLLRTSSLNPEFGAEQLPLKRLPKRVEVDAAFANHSKLRCFFRPPTPVRLTEGLQRMARWMARTQGSRAAPQRISSVEVRQHLPPSWDHEGMSESDYIQDLRPHADLPATSNSDVRLYERPSRDDSGSGMDLLRSSYGLLVMSLLGNLACAAHCCGRKVRWRPRTCE
eukprot:COSAG02_NODE_224_length_28285_cov_39.533066_12_plen_517_part_00